MLERVAVEVVKQVGAGVREFLRERRNPPTTPRPPAPTPPQPPQPPKPPEPPVDSFATLRQVLEGLGFTAAEVRAAVAAPEVCALASAPVEDQIRAALRVLRP